MRKVCDEVFGEDNFVAQIIWQRAFAPKNDSKYTSNDHDYILMYSKNINEFEIGKLRRTEEANNRYKNYDNDIRGNWISDNLTVKTYSEKYDYPITTPSGRVVNPSHGSCWRVSKEKLEELKRDNRIWFGATGENVPRLKRFLSEVQDGMVSSSLWLHKEVGHSQEGRQELKKIFDDKGFFDGPKPVRLLSRLLTIANTDKDDIILDFFSGSATTAHAVMQLNAEDNGNRKFILVQLPEITDEKSEAYKAGYINICEIGKERIRRAGEKIKTELEEKSKQQSLDTENKIDSDNLDIGFRVLKLDTSSVKKWDMTTPENKDINMLMERINNMVDSIKPDRTDLDVVFEVILKLGLDLNISVNEMDIMGKKVWVIGDDCLIMICLDINITTKEVAVMAEYAPGNMVFTDGCFVSTSEMVNVELLLRDLGVEMRMV